MARNPNVNPPAVRAQQGRNNTAAPEFNALGGPTYDEPPRTVDEQWAFRRGLAPVGSKDYVAGQPVDDEEAARTESLARVKAEAAGPDRTTPEGIRRLREQEEQI